MGPTLSCLHLIFQFLFVDYGCYPRPLPFFNLPFYFYSRTRGTGNNKPALPPIDLIREFYREEAWALINNKDLWNNIVISYAQAGPIV